jgi:hypothetical protein
LTSYDRPEIAELEIGRQELGELCVVCGKFVRSVIRIQGLIFREVLFQGIGDNLDGLCGVNLVELFLLLQLFLEDEAEEYSQ